MSENNRKILQVGEDIKPTMDLNDVCDILKEIYGLEDGEVKEIASFDDKNYYFHSPKINRNPKITQLWPNGYVLKVMNSLDSQKTILTEGQNSMMLFLSDKSFACTVPVKNMSGSYYSIEKLPWKKPSQNQKEHVVRLLEFQPGQIMNSLPGSYKLYYKAGVFLARLNLALKEFHHVAYDEHESMWTLNSVVRLVEFLPVVKDDDRRNLVSDIILDFKEKVLSKIDSFEKGMIHGDYNEHNILLRGSESGDLEISAILDFGDSSRSYYIFELAIAMCYMMFEANRNRLDPIIAAGHILAGYQRTFKSEFDYSLLKICTCARFCQSLVLSLNVGAMHPDNEYVLEKQKVGWTLLADIWKTPMEKIEKIWKDIVANETS